MAQRGKSDADRQRYDGVPNPSGTHGCQHGCMDLEPRDGIRMTDVDNDDDLESVARNLVAPGKGILAADETVSTITRRFATLGIKSTAESRRTYREMLVSGPDVDRYISGVILHDETFRQKGSDGRPLTRVLSRRGIVPGIKVDAGAKPLAGFPDETITEGLDGLRDRLSEYRDIGARFAKWRAVFHVSDVMPTPGCVRADAHALARYAALCQDQHLVPIVEPEVLMDGSHPIERCEEVTGGVLEAVFDALFEQRVALEGILLKPNMVVPGNASARRAPAAEVAIATLRCLRRHVPAAVPGIVFLSGGQEDRSASAHLNEINRLPESKPWRISFSYGRALQDPALEAWHGQQDNLEVGRRALCQRARCNSAASLGRYTDEMESPRGETDSSRRSDWSDD
jgi:fructose-bisphosphate aldolase, class I